MGHTESDSSTQEFPTTSKRGVRQRLLRGLGSTALNPVVTAIIQLGTVPLMLHYWGAARYGDWLILSAIPSYLTLANLGFGDASGSDMTVRVARGDRQGALETFQSSWALLLIISAAVLAIIFSFIWWVPWVKWMHLSSLSDREAAGVIFVFATYVIVAQQSGIFESGYRCDGNFASGTFWDAIQRLTEAVLAAVVGAFTGSLLYSALTFLVLRGLGVCAYALLLRRKSPWLSLGLRNVRRDRIRELAAPACGFMALPLGNAIGIQGFTVLIGILAGPIAVTVFSTLRTLARINFQITMALARALWPEFSLAFGAGNIRLARALHRRAYQAGLALSLATGSFLWFAGPWIYRVWIHRSVNFDTTCFHILLLVTFVNSMWYTSSVVPMSTNAHHRLTIAFLVASACSLAIGGLLIPAFGISGAAAALLLVDLIMVLLVLRTSLSQLQESFAGFGTAIFRLPSAWQEAD